METKNQIITLSECREFFNTALDSEDYDLIASMCGAKTSTVRKYIKEDSPTSFTGRVLSERIVVHGFAVIEKKKDSIIQSMKNLLSNKTLPDLTK